MNINRRRLRDEQRLDLPALQDGSRALGIALHLLVFDDGLRSVDSSADDDILPLFDDDRAEQHRSLYELRVAAMSDHSDLVARLRDARNHAITGTDSFVAHYELMEQAADALDVKPGANADLIALEEKVMQAFNWPCLLPGVVKGAPCVCRFHKDARHAVQVVFSALEAADSRVLTDEMIAEKSEKAISHRGYRAVWVQGAKWARALLTAADSRTVSDIEHEAIVECLIRADMYRNTYAGVAKAIQAKFGAAPKTLFVDTGDDLRKTLTGGTADE